MNPTSESNSNYLHVGNMTACGHCQPDKYATVEGVECSCLCHTPQQEGWGREDGRMEIIFALEDISGDIWCDCKPLNEVINRVFDRLLLQQKQEIKERVEGLLKDFPNGYMDTDYPQAIRDVLSLLSDN